MEILIVEDEPFIREGILYLLSGSGLFGEDDTIHTACDGAQAWQHITQTGRLPDLVVTDIRMPQMSGLELLERIRKHSQATRAIFISGYEEFEYARQAIQLSACGYVTKPIDQEELLSLIRSALRAIRQEDRQQRETELVQLRERPLERSLQEVLEQIETAPGTISLKSVSEQWNCSPATVSQTFKMQTGRNFKEYLLACKMLKARELLVRGAGAQEICDALGYSDYDYFSKMFKRYYGESPAEYRRRHSPE